MEGTDMTHAPHEVVMHTLMGAWVTQAVGTLARLRIPDAIASGAVTAAAIAEKVGANADAVNRLLRGCATAGFVKATGPKTYALTDAGDLLRSDHPRSMRALLDAETAPGHWLPWARLDACVKRGKSVADEVLGGDVWSYYEKNAEEGLAFSQAMSGMSAMAIGAIDASYTLPDAKHVVDVGGAHGAFLSWALGKLPKAKGVLFDRANVVESAKGLDPRIERAGGDFTREVPRGGDLYLVKHILHDWDDATCRKILQNVATAMQADARVVIVEMLVPDDGTPSPATLLDLNMLVMLPGRERTAGEMRELCASAGLAIDKIVQTPSPFAVIEAIKAR
jgi:hypothetical protein